jgi:hypothetical protein
MRGHENVGYFLSFLDCFPLSLSSPSLPPSLCPSSLLRPLSSTSSFPFPPRPLKRLAPGRQVRTLAAGARARKERVQEMTRLLLQLKQDMMNRTLYALTLVTFLSTPVVLLTGTFGMNFSDMWELVRTTPFCTRSFISRFAFLCCSYLEEQNLSRSPLESPPHPNLLPSSPVSAAATSTLSLSPPLWH